MAVRLGTNPIAWSNDDMPELGLSEDVFAPPGEPQPEAEVDPEETVASGAADESEAVVPEGVDDQVAREALADEGDGDTPGSTVDE